MRITPVASFVLLGFSVALTTAGTSAKNEETEKRVINGVNASPQEVPWQVSLRYNGRHLCGGSLLSSRWVVTAAHCLTKDTDPKSKAYTVHLGAQYSSSTIDGEEVRRVIFRSSHWYFKGGHMRNDVALVALDRDVVFTKNIQTIQLPAPGSSIATGTKCILSGWGRTYTDGPTAKVLQKATLPVADHSKCDSTNSHRKVDQNTMLCAGGEGLAGSCHGDSGGPLACKERGKWVLRGIVSWGTKTCSTNHFTVFARVSSFVNWILKVSAKAG